MEHRAVIFDLYGTLVPPFPRTEHTRAVAETAAVLGLDAEVSHQLWTDSYPRRIRGEFASIAEYFAWFGVQVGRTLPAGACHEAAGVYAEFTRASLVPLPGVLETVAAIAGSGRRLGLLTNRTPDVADHFPGTELGRYFPAPVFSSKAGVVKPAPDAYARALAAVGVPPAEVLYVGDGSDGELTGARAAGMTAVLVTPSLHDTYDQHRPEVEAWQGPRIGTIPEVLEVLGGAG